MTHSADSAANKPKVLHPPAVALNSGKRKDRNPHASPRVERILSSCQTIRRAEASVSGLLLLPLFSRRNRNFYHDSAQFAGPSCPSHDQHVSTRIPGQLFFELKRIYVEGVAWQVDALRCQR